MKTIIYKFIPAALLLFSIACSQPKKETDTSTEVESKISLSKDVVLTNPPLIGEWNNFKVFEGGFSGIHYIEGSDFEFYLINDRGPNLPMNNHSLANGKQVKLFPFPNYSQKLVRVKVEGQELVVKELMELKDANGIPLNGLSVPFLEGSHAELAWKNTNADVIPESVQGVDIEAIVFQNDSIFWFVEEYRPSIWKMNKNTGRQLAIYSPYSEDSNRIALPEVVKKRKPNRGFEAIAATSTKIYAMLQSPMWNPDETVESKSQLTRIVQLDTETNEVKTLIYELTATKGALKQKDWKIGDMIAINENQLVVLEHGSRDNDIFVDVYQIDLSEASLIDSDTIFEKSIESYHTAEKLKQETGIISVKKTHLFNLVEAGYDISLGKPEGMTMIGDSLLVLLNDNDYGIETPNEDGEIIETNVKTHLMFFRIKN